MLLRHFSDIIIAGSPKWLAKPNSCCSNAMLFSRTCCISLSTSSVGVRIPANIQKISNTENSKKRIYAEYYLKIAYDQNGSLVGRNRVSIYLGELILLLEPMLCSQTDLGACSSVVLVACTRIQWEEICHCALQIGSIVLYITICKKQ